MKTNLRLFPVSNRTHGSSREPFLWVTSTNCIEWHVVTRYSYESLTSIAISSKKICCFIALSKLRAMNSKMLCFVIFRSCTFSPGFDFTGSKLVIGRTAFRDNSSHYTLNGRQVSQKEVTKILRQNGIDLEHDRFLILQVGHNFWLPFICYNSYSVRAHSIT